MKWFSRAGILVVESREYTVSGRRVVDFIVDKPLEAEFFNELYKLLSEINIQVLQLKAEKPLIRLIEVDGGARVERFKLALTVASLITIGLTGYGLSESFLYFQQQKGAGSTLELLLLNTLAYTLLFTLVLLVHELGHIYASRGSGVKIRGPILIPAPPIQLGFIGTLGAVIFMERIPASRRDLARIGIYGPLAGFAAATIVGLAGLALSPVIPESEALKMIESGELSAFSVSSLAMLLILMVKGSGFIVMHPLLFISYVMYIVTFLNLLPIGQLDGGHVARSFMDTRTHRMLGLATIILLFATGGILAFMGFSSSSFYISLGVVALLLYTIVARGGHPGCANQYSEAKCIPCLVAYIALLILTAPIPVW